MGRIYSIPWTGSILVADGNMDLWEILPADDKPATLRGFRLGQTSEEKDAEEWAGRITVKRLAATVTGGSGGAAGAPESPDSADAAPGFASEVNNDVVATTSGSTDILDEIGWNLRNTPYTDWYPDKRFAPKAKQGEGLVVRLEDTVPQTVTFVGCIWVEED